MTSLYSHDISFGFILVDYQIGLWEKYLVTGDWSQSNPPSVYKKLGCLATHRALNNDSNQPAHLRRLIWVIVWRTCDLLGSCRKCCAVQLEAGVVIYTLTYSKWAHVQEKYKHIWCHIGTVKVHQSRYVGAIRLVYSYAFLATVLNVLLTIQICSWQWELIIAPGKPANRDDLGISFRSSI